MKQNKNTARTLLTQQTAIALRPGDKLELVTIEMGYENVFGAGDTAYRRSVAPGGLVTVKRVDQGNMYIYLEETPFNGLTCYIHWFMEPVGKLKIRPFSKTDVENYSIEGGNVRLKSEMTIRVNNIKNKSMDLLKENEYTKANRYVREQLRQLSMIQAAIKPLKQP